jgi:hypothetical protein
MKIFCDTNVLVAAFLQRHPHHNTARPVLERVKAGQDEGFVASLSLTHRLRETTFYRHTPRLGPSTPTSNPPSGCPWSQVPEHFAALVTGLLPVLAYCCISGK